MVYKCFFKIKTHDKLMILLIESTTLNFELRKQIFTKKLKIKKLNNKKLSYLKSQPLIISLQDLINYLADN